MKVSREELVESFRQLSDEELLERVKAGNLTEVAQEVAADELNSRGLELPVVPAAEESNLLAQFPDERDRELVILASRLINPLEANVLRSCLESHGIYAHVGGEHLGVVHILLSTGTGGMRVLVPRGQLAEAREIMAAWERGEIAIDGQLE